MILVLSVSLLNGGHWESGRTASIRCELWPQEATTQASLGVTPPAASDSLSWSLEHEAGILASGSIPWLRTESEEGEDSVARQAEIELDIVPVRAVTRARLVLIDRRDGEVSSWSMRDLTLYPPISIPDSWRNGTFATPWHFAGRRVEALRARLDRSGIEVQRVDHQDAELGPVDFELLVIDQEFLSRPGIQPWVTRTVRNGATAVVLGQQNQTLSVGQWSGSRVEHGFWFVLEAPDSSPSNESVDPRVLRALIDALSSRSEWAPSDERPAIKDIPVYR